MSLRSNLFGGKCVDCRRDVPAGRGVEVLVKGRRRVSWGVRCAECVAAQKKGEPMPVGTEEGLELHTPEYERRIAETLADRRPSRKDVLERAERRERIATRLLAGYCANPRAGDASMTREALAELACLMADALVAELDRRRDAELQEARS